MTTSDRDAPATIEPSAFTPLDASQEASSKGFNPRVWLLAACAAVFLLIMVFLLTSRSLQVLVVAENPAEVTVSGLALPFGDRYLLRPGDYTASATAEGYHPLETSISVDREDSQTVELVLQPLPGLLSISSTPEGATVLLDSQPVGVTPLQSLAVEAGEYTLALQTERYLPLEQPLAITGRRIEQHLQLIMDPAWAEVSLDSAPPGATILVDGEDAGTTPATIEILQGEHQLMLQMPSFASWSTDVEITAGEPLAVDLVELQPAAGMLELVSQPAGANVTVDGEFQGQTPLTLEITPDREHRLAVFKPGYRRHTETLQLAAGASDSRTVKLRAQLGEVRFNIQPANAVVRINGQPRGKGSQTLSLPAFEHTVEITLDGHASERRRVTPRPGLQQLIEVTLLTVNEEKKIRIKPQVTTSLGQDLLLFNPMEAGTGDFSMGASRREPGRRANEVLHPVSLTRLFYLQSTEVTNAQFRLFDASHNSGQIEGNSLNREHQPAVQVSWNQAATFCNWLSKREGLPAFYRESNGIITGYNPSSTGYRLPTEAEWAWAARSQGATLLKFPWGEQFPPTNPVENYADNTSAYVTGRILNGYKDGHVVSATVASFPAGNKGLYDMGGNVAEWIHDVYAIPSANGGTQVDPLGAQNGDNYVIRGASWTHSKIAELRLSHRDYGQAGRDDVGFRLARYAE